MNKNMDFFDTSDPPKDVYCTDAFYKLFLQEYKKVRSRGITFGAFYLSGRKKTFVKFIIHSWAEKRGKVDNTPVKSLGKVKRNSEGMEG